MKSRLDRINDWEDRLVQARYRVAALAKLCGVSERQLRRYVESKFGQTPHVWTIVVRLEKAPQVLSQGELVKRVAIDVGFRQPAHFSREFKRHYGVSPITLRSSPYRNGADGRFG
jgi:AraC-like DNA-binding protein